MKAEKSSRQLRRADATKNTSFSDPARHLGLTVILASAVMALTCPSVHAATASVNLGSTAQTIRGFGGAVIWEAVLADADCDKLFGSGAGTIGFTIERVRVAPDTASWANDRGNAQKAKARGAIVFATPWSPPASMKSNNNIIGGSLNTSQYGAFASYLNSFVSDLAANNASLYAISVQNEPDFLPDYESCGYTSTQMFNFIKNNAGVINTKVIAAETVQFNKAYTDGALNDTTARANLDIVGTHLYGGGITDYPLARNNGKEVWMTEHLNLDTSITGQMQVAKEILDCFAVANFNAYVWWQMKRDYGPIDLSGNRTKRGCVFAQFARIVRPGWVRVNATYNPTSGVVVAAFKSGTKMAIIAVNSSTSSVSQTFSISGGTIPSSLNCWRTSSSQDLATLAAVGVSGGAFTNSLPGQSVTTYYTP
jgi:glucuronoarabinoxylan endo-1,4-beta-xylanase